MTDDTERHVAASEVRVDRALRHVERSSRLLKAVMLATGLLTLAAVTAFGVVNVVRENDTLARLARQQRALNAEQANVLAILRAVQAQTDPRMAEERASQVNVLVDHLIVCVENHSDRVGATIRRVPLPPLVDGCPADSLVAAFDAQQSQAAPTPTAPGPTSAGRPPAPTPAPSSPSPAPPATGTVPAVPPGQARCHADVTVPAIGVATFACP